MSVENGCIYLVNVFTWSQSSFENVPPLGNQTIIVQNLLWSFVSCFTVYNLSRFQAEFCPFLGNLITQSRAQIIYQDVAHFHLIAKVFLCKPICYQSFYVARVVQSKVTFMISKAGSRIMIGLSCMVICRPNWTSRLSSTTTGSKMSDRVNLDRQNHFHFLDTHFIKILL